MEYNEQNNEWEIPSLNIGSLEPSKIVGNTAQRKLAMGFDDNEECKLFSLLCIVIFNLI